MDWSIVQFVYNKIEPEFACPQPMDEAVPKFFKEIGYPCVLKPSTLSSMGSMTSFYHVLGALQWLIEHVTVRSSPLPFLPFFSPVLPFLGGLLLVSKVK